MPPFIGSPKDIDRIKYRVIGYGGIAASADWTAQVISDDAQSSTTSGVLRLGVSATLQSQGSDTVVQALVQIPQAYSLRTKSRRWERLSVQQQAGPEIGAWLVLNNDESEPPAILLYLKPDTARFMASLPDETPFQDFALAGTHDSCAFYGYPYAQCQQPSTTIEQQLNDGVRFLDLRMRLIDGELIMYHGIRNQRAHFTSVLSTIHSFLSTNPSESILVSLKEEVPPIHPDFSRVVYEAFEPYIDKFWFLQSRLPTIGEVRGKGMIMPRFPINLDEGESWNKGVGLKTDTWPDNLPEGFEIMCGSARIRVQDWYGIPNFLRIPEKFEAVVRHLTPTSTTIALSDYSREAGTPQSERPLTISYISAASVPLAPPATVAKGFGWPSIGLGVEGINSRMTRWILEVMCEGKRIRGIVPGDFYREDGELAELLVVMNTLENGECRVLELEI